MQFRPLKRNELFVMRKRGLKEKRRKSYAKNASLRKSRSGRK